MTKIKYKKFEDLEFVDAGWGVFTHKQAVIMFENSYGASVVIGEFTYGGKSGLYELAVLNSKGDLTYDTPITSDVLGYLSQEDVTDVLINIQKLK